MSKRRAEEDGAAAASLPTESETAAEPASTSVPASSAVSSPATSPNGNNGNNSNNKRRRVEAADSAASERAGQPNDVDERFERIWDELTNCDRAKFGESCQRYDQQRPPASYGNTALRELQVDDWQTLHRRGYDWNDLAMRIRGAGGYLYAELRVGLLTFTTGRARPSHLHHHCCCNGIHVATHNNSTTNAIAAWSAIRAHLTGLMMLIAPVSATVRLEISSHIFIKAFSQFENASFQELNLRGCSARMDAATTARLMQHEHLAISTKNLSSPTAFLQPMVSSTTPARLTALIFEVDDDELPMDLVADAFMAAKMLFCVSVLGTTMPLHICEIIAQHPTLVGLDIRCSVPSLLALLRHTRLHKLKVHDANTAVIDRERTGRCILDAVRRNRTLTSLKLPEAWVSLNIQYYDMEQVFRLNQYRNKVWPVVIQLLQRREMASIAHVMARLRPSKQAHLIFEILQLSNQLLSCER